MSPDRSRRREWFTGRGAFDDLARAVTLSQGGGEWAVTAALLAAPLIALTVHQLAVVRRPVWHLASFVAAGFVAATPEHAAEGFASATVGAAVVLAFLAVPCRRASPDHS